MKLFKQAIHVFFAIGGLYLAISNVIDLRSLYSSPNTYEKLYGFNFVQSHWQFQSTDNYQIWRIAQLIIYLFIFLFATLKLFKSQKFKKITPFYWGTVLVLVFWLVRYYILWVQSGYDHYPGFDPYLL